MKLHARVTEFNRRKYPVLTNYSTNGVNPLKNAEC